MFCTRKPLGTDGEEVTALLGNMPGGLELLLDQNYTDNAGNKSWLSFPVADGLSVVELPKADPHEEIYLKKDVFYRVVNPDWLDPGAALNTKLPSAETPWSKYSIYLKTAESFHLKAQDYVHPVSYQFYSEGLNTADRVVYSRHPHGWQTKGKRLLSIIKADLPGELTKSALTGLVVGFNPVSFVIKQAGVAILKDADFMSNRGGFRCYVNEQNIDITKDSDDALFVMQLTFEESYDY